MLDEGAGRELAAGWVGMLGGLAAHVTRPGAGGFTPSDFPLVALAQGQLEELEAEFADDDMNMKERGAL